MKRFRREFRYVEVTNEEHPGDCACGRCISFDQWCEKRIYGAGHVERGGIVYGQNVATEMLINQR